MGVCELVGVWECNHTASLSLSACDLIKVLLKKKMAWALHGKPEGFPLGDEEEGGGTGGSSPLSPWPSCSQVQWLVPAVP